MSNTVETGAKKMRNIITISGRLRDGRGHWAAAAAGGTLVIGRN